MNTCNNCGIEFEGRQDAKFCSAKCRVTFSRKQSIVTDNVTLSDPVVTDNFRFKTNAKDGKAHETSWRTARYWYDVPLAAKAKVEADWPEQGSLNGRQYFLWWKNEFTVNEDPEKGKIGQPVILNPLPVRENLKYEMGGDSSRKWGA